MADIDIERKKKSPLPWILGLLALAVLLFLLMSTCGGDDEAEDTGAVVDTTTAMNTTPAAPAPAPMTDPAAVAPAAGAAAGAGWIASVLGGQMAGQTASGEGTVPSTPTDRGFWIEENGQRVYAILSEPMEQVKDIDPGQRVRISQARVLSSADASQIPQDVEAETRQTASGQPHFLLVPAAGVEILSGGNTTAN